MRTTAARWWVVALLLVALPAGADGPRLTIGPVRRDPRAAIPTQLAERLCGTYGCVLWKEVSTRREPDLGKARAREVLGILVGEVAATPGGKKVTLSLLTTSARATKTWTFPLTAAGRLSASDVRRLEQDLDALLRRPAPAAASPPIPTPPTVTAPAPVPALVPSPARAVGPPQATEPTPAARLPAPPAPVAPAARRWVLAAELGAFANLRRLSYGGVSTSTGTLLGFDAARLIGPTVSLEVFPLAHGASLALGGAGLHAGLATSVGLRTQSPTGERLSARFSRLEIGARWRSPPVAALRLVLVPGAAWVSQRYTVSRSIPGLPDSELSGVRVGLSAESRVASRVIVLAGVGWVKWLSAGDLVDGQPAFFPGSGATGLEAELGAGLGVWGPLSVRVLGWYASTRYTLAPDPTGTYAASSAEDRYLGLRAVLRGEF